MKNPLLLSLLLAFTCFSGIAAAIECPDPESIVATKMEEDSDKVSSMVYCSPSEVNCEWKGYDPMAEKKSTVTELINADNQATENNGLTYCDYKLASGDQIRMSLEK